MSVANKSIAEIERGLKDIREATVKLFDPIALMDRPDKIGAFETIFNTLNGLEE